MAKVLSSHVQHPTPARIETELLPCERAGERNDVGGCDWKAQIADGDLRAGWIGRGRAREVEERVRIEADDVDALPSDYASDLVGAEAAAGWEGQCAV